MSIRVSGTSGTAVTVGTTTGTVAAGDDSRITSAVPNTRTVNGKALSANVALSSADVPGSFVGGPLDLLPVMESGLPVEIARYDADSVSPQTDATSVSSWPDDTGTTGALTQATGANQPVLKLAQINGHSAVRFTGGNFWMSKALTLSTNFTLILVGKPSGVGGNNAIAIGNYLTAYSGRICGPGQGATQSPSAAFPGWAIYRITVTAGTAVLYRNGVPIASSAASNMTTLYVGQDGGNNFYSDWDIAHIRAYSGVVVPEEAVGVEKVLARRYGLTTGSGAPSVRSRTNTTLNGQNITLSVPEGYIVGQSVPLLVFSHGGGGNQDSYGYGASPGVTLDAALALGYAVATSNLHGDSTGNAQQLQDNLDLVNWVKTQIGVSKLVLAGQSLGGLPTLNAITKNTYASTGLSVQGALLLYPVIAMTGYPTGATGTQVITSYSLSNGTLSSAASISATSISSSVLYASGTVIQINTGAGLETVTVTGTPTGSGPYATPVTALTKNHSSGVVVSDYPTKVTNAGYDPMTQPASAFGNKRYRMYGSTSDVTVDVTANSIAFQTKIASTAREASFVATRGAHGDLSNFNGRDQAQFLIRCLNDPVIA